MKNIIVGTAGHVDHGKTTLIKALTGMDTDRLKEEKERGMTIDLGFASLALPNGQVVGIVDVPGHERFIKNMLAGAGGVDVALLVIAADESVMPQTVEHLDILKLLEVQRGVVALTKADMVEPDWIEVVKDDVRLALADTFLADAPVIPVASPTGGGISELLTAIQEACEKIEARDTSGAFRMPVDRVFTMTGFGTVTTGTLISGTVKVGDAVEVMPTGLSSRIRQLHVHGQKVESASAGMRVAMNLVGLDLSEIARGDTCATPGLLKSSTVLDLKLALLGSTPHPVTNRTRVRLHIGTSELLGRVVLLDRDELKPGDQAFVQFRSESPVAALKGDRFVIRSYSPMVTVGGGVVVSPVSRRLKRFDATTMENLETTSKGSPEELLEQAIRQSPTGMTAAEAAKSAGQSDAASLLASLKDASRIVELEGGRLLHASVYADLVSRVSETLGQFHAKQPLKLGMPKEELRGSAVKAFDSRGFAALLAYMERNSVLLSADTTVSLPEHEIELSPAQQKAAEKMSADLRRAEFAVPSFDELLQASGLPLPVAKDIAELLVQRNELVKVADDLYFHSATMAKAESLIREHILKNGSITVSQFRDISGSSRKYAVPLMEYFDHKRVTRRVGDERVLVTAISGGR